MKSETNKDSGPSIGDLVQQFIDAINSLDLFFTPNEEGRSVPCGPDADEWGWEGVAWLDRGKADTCRDAYVKVCANINHQLRNQLDSRLKFIESKLNELLDSKPSQYIVDDPKARILLHGKKRDLANEIVMASRLLIAEIDGGVSMPIPEPNVPAKSPKKPLVENLIRCDKLLLSIKSCISSVEVLHTESSMRELTDDDMFRQVSNYIIMPGKKWEVTTAHSLQFPQQPWDCVDELENVVSDITRGGGEEWINLGLFRVAIEALGHLKLKQSFLGKTIKIADPENHALTRLEWPMVGIKPKDITDGLALILLIINLAVEECRASLDLLSTFNEARSLRSRRATLAACDRLVSLLRVVKPVPINVSTRALTEVTTWTMCVGYPVGFFNATYGFRTVADVVIRRLHNVGIQNREDGGIPPEPISIIDTIKRLISMEEKDVEYPTPPEEEGGFDKRGSKVLEGAISEALRTIEAAMISIAFDMQNDNVELEREISKVKAAAQSSTLNINLKEAIACTLSEMAVCMRQHCWIASIALTGRVVEACLKHMLTLSGRSLDTMDRLGIDALWSEVRKSGSGGLLRETQLAESWIDTLCRYRNANVHDKSAENMPSVPSPEMAKAAALICIDLVKRTLSLKKSI